MSTPGRYTGNCTIARATDNMELVRFGTIDVRDV